MSKIFFVLLVMLSLSASAVLSGCHTMSGAGEDIEQGGKAISNEADRHTD